MKVAAGTTPPGTSNEREAAGWVRRMFTDITPRYDLLNHLLSFHIDRGWRKALGDCLESVLKRNDARILDLCCGTGDVLFHLEDRGAAQIVGADFCHPMLVSANQKAAARGRAAQLLEADALELPLADNSLDAISIAFGFRNLANYRAGLAEFQRVLKPGGVLAILEFSHPRSWLMKSSYGFYSRVVVPAVGALVSGSREAYGYLPESIRMFPAAGELRAMLESSGFVQTNFELLTGGIAALHTGRKAADASG
ncbi:MAG TPA: bifunctional demethylmenaquinone methyltransferase/2-methoxy-6-polyprenyl-1,4-benzoquinol methylase UbiE [Bryobacteraceae bacterium]